MKNTLAYTLEPALFTPILITQPATLSIDTAGKGAHISSYIYSKCAEHLISK